MARMIKALCMRDCVKDAREGDNVGYVRYRAGKEYLIPEDSEMLVHFNPLEELSKKESERVVEEAQLEAPVEPKTGKPRPKKE